LHLQATKDRLSGTSRVYAWLCSREQENNLTRQEECELVTRCVNQILFFVWKSLLSLGK